jgi:hypothetical protein
MMLLARGPRLPARSRRDRQLPRSTQEVPSLRPLAYGKACNVSLQCVQYDPVLLSGLPEEGLEGSQAFMLSCPLTTVQGYDIIVVIGMAVAVVIVIGDSNSSNNNL